MEIKLARRKLEIGKVRRKCAEPLCDKQRDLMLFNGDHYCEIHLQDAKAEQYTYNLRRENAKRLGMEVPKGL